MVKILKEVVFQSEALYAYSRRSCQFKMLSHKKVAFNQGWLLYAAEALKESIGV